MADRLAIILYTLYSEDNKREWRSRNLKGFEFVSCEGDGNDDGYEPKFRKGWY
jgi:hypothetical protein